MLAFDAATSATSLTTTLSWLHVPVGVPDLVIVGVSSRTAVSGTPTYGGAAMTAAGADSTTGSTHARVWYIQNPGSGTKTVSVTLAAGTTESVGGAISWIGSHPVTPIGDYQIGNSAGTTAGSITCKGDLGDFAVGVICVTGGAPTNKQTSRWTTSIGATPTGGGGETTPSIGTTTLSWTTGNLTQTWVGVNIRGTGIPEQDRSHYWDDPGIADFFGPNPFCEDRGADIVAGNIIYQVALTATSTTTAAFQFLVSKLFSGSSPATASVQKQTNKGLSATVSGGAALVKLALKSLVASATSSSSLQKQVNKSLSSTPTASASLQKQTSKSFSGNATASGSIQKTALKKLTATVTTTASMVTSKLIQLALTAGATVTGSLQKQVSKLLSGSGPTSGVLSKLIFKNQTATGTTTATTQKTVNKPLSATSSSSASITTSRLIQVLMTAGVSTIGSIRKLIAKNVSASAPTSATQQKRVGKVLSTTPTTSASMTTGKVFSLVLIATSTVTGVLTSLFVPFVVTGKRVIKWFNSKAGWYTQ